MLKKSKEKMIDVSVKGEECTESVSSFAKKMFTSMSLYSTLFIVAALLAYKAPLISSVILIYIISNALNVSLIDGLIITSLFDIITTIHEIIIDGGMNLSVPAGKLLMGIIILPAFVMALHKHGISQTRK